MNNPDPEIKNLQKKVNNLEKRVERLEFFSGVSSGQPGVEHESIAHKKEDIHRAPSKPNAFMQWLTTDWLMKLGAFFLILALGWFVTYAYANEWIGPQGVVSLSLIAGLGIMVFGHLQIPKREDPGKVLIVTGGVMMLITLIAAWNVWELFGKNVVLSMSSLVILAMAVMSVIHKSRSIAYITLIGGAIIPFALGLISDEIGTLAYIFLLNIGTLIIVAMRGWRGLILASLIITGLYSTLLLGMNQTTIWLFMALFFGLFLISIVSAIIHSKKAQRSDLIVSGINGLLFLAWAFEFVPEEWLSIVLSLVALGLVGTGFLVLKQTKLPMPFYIHSALAILFIGLATAAELEGEALVIAYALEALLITILSQKVVEDKKVTEYLSFIQVIPATMALGSFANYYGGEVISRELFSILLVIAVFVAIYLMLKKDRKTSIPLMHLGAAFVFFLGLIWVFITNLSVELSLATNMTISDYTLARIIALIVYTVMGVSMFYYGDKNSKKSIELVGKILLACVIVRLLFVEVWEMPRIARIVTFVSVGVLLVATAFFQKRLKK